jgi:hypothetical protein
MLSECFAVWRELVVSAAQHSLYYTNVNLALIPSHFLN